MKKALQPQRVPQPQMVVAVPSLTPEFTLWNTATGEMKRVYGGNLCENSVYVDGVMPKVFRMAAEDGSHEQEYLLHPLPDNIEEIVLQENPECRLLIANYTLIPAPVVKPKAECVVRELPAARERKKQIETEALQKKQEAEIQLGILPLFPNYQPNRQTA